MFKRIDQPTLPQMHSEANIHTVEEVFNNVVHFIFKISDLSLRRAGIFKLSKLFQEDRRRHMRLTITDQIIQAIAQAGFTGGEITMFLIVRIGRTGDMTTRVDGGVIFMRFLLQKTARRLSSFGDKASICCANEIDINSSLPKIRAFCQFARGLCAATPRRKGGGRNSAATHQPKKQHKPAHVIFRGVVIGMGF